MNTYKDFPKIGIANHIALVANSLPKASFVLVEPASKKANFGPDRLEIVFAMSTRHAEQIGREEFNMCACTALAFETMENYQQIKKMLRAIPQITGEKT